MIFECTEKTGLRDIGKDNRIKNETILEILENAGGEHSNTVRFWSIRYKSNKSIMDSFRLEG